MPTGARDAQH